MALQLSYRRPNAPKDERDHPVALLLTGEGITISDFTDGQRRVYAIHSTADNQGQGYVHILDPEVVVMKESGEQRTFDDTHLTESNRLAIIPPGEVYGLPLVSQPGYIGHLIIETVNMDLLLDPSS